MQEEVLQVSSMKSCSRTRAIQGPEVMIAVKRIHEMQKDRAVKRRREALTMLEEDGYLLRLCRRMEWKDVGKLLSLMLDLLRQNEGELSSESRTQTTKTISSSPKRENHSGPFLHSNNRCQIVQKVRQQLLAQDSNGNNCLHLICYLKPPSSRILPLLFQVARAADGVALSSTRNDHASTAVMVACSYRFSRSLIHALLQHGEVSLEAIVACDRQGNTPFTGLIQCYCLSSKIPSFRNRYIDLETVNASFFPIKPVSGKLEPFDYTNHDGMDEWDEERRGSFPLLWDTCTNLILTGWQSTFPGTFCPSLLHGAALVAPAIPPLLIDVMLRFYGSHVDSSMVADLIPLVLKGTTIALQKSCHLTHYAMYQKQALHFVRKLLHVQTQERELRSEQTVLSYTFHDAINVSLTWHLILENDEVDQQRDNTTLSLPWNGGNQFDRSRPSWTTSNHLATSQVIRSPDCHYTDPIGWLQVLLTLYPDALKVRDRTHGLFPFQLAALPQKRTLDCHHSGHDKDPNLILDTWQVDTIYNLLLSCPDVIKTYL